MILLSFGNYNKIKLNFLGLLFLLIICSNLKAADYSLEFDRLTTSEYVEVPFDVSMNPTGDFSVNAWVKVKASNDWQSVVTSRSADTACGALNNRTKGYMLYIQPDEDWSFWNGRCTTNTWAKVDTSVSVNLNTWQMQTVTYDASETMMKLYIDGVLKGNNNSDTLTANSNRPLRIGAGATNEDTPRYWFNGKIDEVAIWSSTLSAAEITQLYNSGETLYAGENYGNYTSASSLGEYWTMDDNVETGNGSGTTLYGEINNNDGTLNGGPSWSTDFPGTLPTLTSSDPVDDATNVSIETNIVLTFSETIKAGTGNITLKKTTDNSTVETFAIGGSNITISGSQITIDPTDFLENNTEYYVLIDSTAVVDLSRNHYAGISSTTELSFSTGGSGPSNPLDDKDISGSLEAQTDAPKKVVQHITTPVFNRLNWIRGYENDENLSAQKIKFNISNPQLAEIFNIIPETVSLNKIPTRSNDDWLFWSEGSVSIGRVGDTSNSSFKEIDTNAITFGWDKKIDDKTIHGYAITYTKDDVKIGNAGSTIDVDSYSFSTYATFHQKKNSYIEGILGASKLDLKNKRVKNNNFSHGDRDGRQIYGSIHYINTVKKEHLNISPNLRLDLSYTTLTEYTETGHNPLRYHEQTVETAGLYGGFTFNKEVFKDNYIIRPVTGFELGYDLSPSSDVTLNYVSDPNTNYSQSIDQEGEESLKGKIGFDLLTETGWSLMAFYQRNQSENSHTDTIYLLTGYVSSKDEEYTMALEDRTASLEYKRNVNGFDISFDTVYGLFNEYNDYMVNLKVSSIF